MLLIITGTWYIAYYWRRWVGGNSMTGITMATKGLTWLDHC